MFTQLFSLIFAHRTFCYRLAVQFWNLIQFRKELGNEFRIAQVELTLLKCFSSCFFSTSFLMNFFLLYYRFLIQGNCQSVEKMNKSIGAVIKQNLYTDTNLYVTIRNYTEFYFRMYFIRFL